MFRVISIFLTLTFTAAVIACPNLSGKYGRCGSKKHASFKIKQEKVDGTTTYHSELTDGTFSGYTITMIADGVKRDAGVEGVSISYRCEKDALIKTTETKIENSSKTYISITKKTINGLETTDHEKGSEKILNKVTCRELKD